MLVWVYKFSVWALPVLIAITFHEAAHGYVAWRLGDETAKRMGRVTFNPLRHIDTVGTIIVPALLLLTESPFLFGWAKPVPVNFNRLRNPRRDMVWVAAAGPGVNLFLAWVSAVLLHFATPIPGIVGTWLTQALYISINFNILLAVFNMFPLPPLDGGRVAVGLLPPALAMKLARLERVGLFIIIGALFILPLIGDRLGVDLNIFPWLVGEPVKFLFNVIARLAGHA